MLKKEGLEHNDQSAIEDEDAREPNPEMDMAKDIPRKSKESEIVCKFFISEKGCKNGMRCVYKHDLEQAPTKGRHKLRICRFFQSRRGCSNGAKCMFLHQNEKGETVVSHSVCITITIPFTKPIRSPSPSFFSPPPLPILSPQFSPRPSHVLITFFLVVYSVFCTCEVSARCA